MQRACKEMVMGLNASVHDKANPLRPEEWKALFRGHPDPPELISLVDRAGLEGFEIGSICVRNNETPVLHVPFFLTRFPLATACDGKAKDICAKGQRYLPDIFAPKVLAVGFAEGEWCQVGINSSVEAPAIFRAWRLALDELDRLTRRRGAQACLFWNVPEPIFSTLPREIREHYVDIPSQPFSQVELNHGTLEQYLDTLDKDMRRYLTRALRKQAEVQVERSTAIASDLDAIYAMYLNTVASADAAFGIHNKEYFARVCADVPGAHYVLYRIDGELIGFELVIESNGKLVSKYFGMDSVLGKANKLYFLSWMLNVQRALDEGLSTLYLGSASENLKAKLGATQLPTTVLLKHRNPLLHKLFNKYKHLLAYEAPGAGVEDGRTLPLPSYNSLSTGFPPSK